MTNFDIKNEEKHITLSGWFSLVLGIVLLAMVFAGLFIENEDKELFNICLVVLFIILAIFYKIKEYFNSKEYTDGYQDEFIRQVSHNAYRRAFKCTIFVIWAVLIFGDVIAIPFDHIGMALVYLAIASLSYGASIIWQNRD